MNFVGVSLSTSCLLLFIGMTANVQAAISVLDSPGLDEPIPAEIREVLSITHGASLVESGILENMRFRGFTGPEKDGIPCDPKFIHKTDPSKSQCPQDTTTAVLQRLFPSFDGVVLVPNQLTFDPFSMLSPSMIGRMVSLIYSLKSNLYSKLNEDAAVDLDSEKWKNYKEDWKGTWIEDQLREIKSPNFSTTFLETYDQSLKEINQTETDDKKRVQKIRKLRLETRSKVKKWKALDDFAELVFQACVDSTRDDYPHPRLSVEGIFKSWMWMKAPNKEWFIPYYRELKLREPYWFLTSGRRSKKTEKWLSRSFSQSMSTFQDRSLLQVSKEFFGSREQLNELFRYLVEQRLVRPKDFFNNEVAYSLESSIAQDRSFSLVMGWALENLFGHQPLAGYGLASHPALGDESFSDCVETAIRDFFNFFLINPGLPVSSKQTLEIISRRQGLHPKPGLIKYYSENGTIADIRTQKARNAWVFDAVSALDGAKFKSPAAHPILNLYPHQSNVLNAMGELLGDQVVKSPHIPPSEKWTRLCEIFSNSSSFQVDWALEEKADRNIVNQMEKGFRVSILIQGQKAMYWDFFDTHHVTLSFAPDDQGRKISDLFPAIAKMTQKFEQRDYTDLAFFLKTKEVDQVRSALRSLGPDFLPIIVYKLNGSSVEDFLLLFDFLSAEKIRRYDFILAKRVSEFLRTGDLHTRKKIYFRLRQLEKITPLSGSLRDSLEYCKLNLTEADLREPKPPAVENHWLDSFMKPNFGPRIKQVQIADRVFDLSSTNPCALFSLPEADVTQGFLLKMKGFREGENRFRIEMQAVDSGFETENPLILLNSKAKESFKSLITTKDWSRSTVNSHEFLRILRYSTAKVKNIQFVNLSQQLQIEGLVFFGESSAERTSILSTLNGFNVKASLMKFGDLLYLNTPSDIILEAGPHAVKTSALKSIRWKNRETRYLMDKVILGSYLGGISGELDFSQDRFDISIWNPGAAIEFCFNGD